MDQERWTIGRLLHWTADFLKKSGSASPRLDAEVLLSEARQCERIQLYTAFDEEPNEAIRTRFRDLVKRRAAGEPVAYLVGRREFYSLSLNITPDVLIPRPETEFVVIAVLDAIKALAITERPPQIADVGTGSGAIAIAVAKHASQCQVTAVDLSANALAIARANAERHGVADRMEMVESDLFAGLPPDRLFDVIASNPPYVAEHEFAALSKEVREFEPRQALVAGAQGTEVILRLVAQAAERLRPGGWLIFEISPMIEDQVRELLRQNARFGDYAVTKDLAGLARVVKVRRQT